ncbi:fibronectin type III domain-containing protein-like [Porites lutea]|uniref:fibronectin type III domain-containing protein-like n=1 Tax=Porites lutea TaxID=51062 RepID=UPI003CC53965
MSWIILFLSVSCFSTLTNGQQQSDPPKIFNFLTKDLVVPEEVKCGTKNALKLPCGASGNNLQWTWKHNDTAISTSDPKFTVDANGTLYGSYLESAQNGHYQCFVRDAVTGIETFSRKIKVDVTVVGTFNDPETKQVVQSVDLGEEFSYGCPQHSPSYGVSYSWMGKSNNQKIQFKGNERRAITQTGHLFIMFVTEEDLKELAGYEDQGIHCEISAAKRFEASSLLKLTKKNEDKTDPKILREPSWKLEFMSVKQEKVLEGKNKTLYCLAAGRPEPKITWKIKRDGKWENLVNEKDNFEIADAFHGRLLNIISVKQKMHQTTYRCEAENSQNVGNQTVYDMQLKVKVAPRFLASPPQQLEIDVNGNDRLTCDVSADPSPTFIWYKNGTKLTKSTEHVRLNGNKLDLKNVRYLQESGVYQCVAENPYGMIVSYTDVKVGPMAPFFETGFGPFYLFNGTEGRLTCNPKAAPWPSKYQYKWYKGTTLLTSSPPYRIEHGEFSTLIIDQVDENRDEGPYKCYAENFLGNATETATATVLERTIITVRPEDKIVEEGSRVDLRCEAKADPSLELRYYWKRYDAVVTYNNKIQCFEGAKVLTIASITVYEAGNYTCVAYTPDPKRSEDQASATIDIGVPGPPSAVNVYAFAKYILVTFKAPVEPNGVITKYRVRSAQYEGSQPSDDLQVSWQEVGPGVFRKLLENQTPERNYVVEIQAETSKRWGDKVRNTTRTVKYAPPAKPERPTVEGTDVGEVKVTYNFGLGGGYTHEFLVMYRTKLQGETFQNTSWINHFETQNITIKGLNIGLYEFKTVGRNDYPDDNDVNSRSESPASDVTEGRPLPSPTTNQPSTTPIPKAAWFIILLTIIAVVLILLIALLIFVHYTRHQGAKYLVGKRERDRTLIEREPPYDKEEGALSDERRVENPSPDQSQSSLRKIPENDGDSLDDYSEGQQFGEDGSFIEEYVDSPQRVGRGPFKKLLGNLTFETSYVVVLQARTSKGWGESSRETTRTIKRMAPAKPDRPTVVETGKHVVSLKYNYGIGGGWTHQFKVLYRKQVEGGSQWDPLKGGEFLETQWMDHFSTQLVKVNSLDTDVYEFKTVGKNLVGTSPESDVIEARPEPDPVVSSQRGNPTVYGKDWFIILMILSACTLILLITVILCKSSKRRRSSSLRERRAFILVAEDEKEKSEEKIATEIAEKSINPRQEWLKRIQDRVDVESQADSLDEYGGDGAYFSEDGSFIGDCKQGGERQSVYEEIPLDDPVV